MRGDPSPRALPEPVPPSRTEPAPAPWIPPQPPPAAQAIKVGDDRPAPSPEPSSAWASDYRDAICACHTRSCVRDLQGAFIRRIGAMVHGDETDDERYSAAMRAAITCYSALPEGS